MPPKDSASSRGSRLGAQALPRMRFRFVLQTGQTPLAIRVPLSFTLTSFCFALLLALHAVELAAPGLGHDGLLADRWTVVDGESGEGPPVAAGCRPP